MPFGAETFAFTVTLRPNCTDVFVRSIPTLLIFKGGKVVGQLVGAMPRSKLEAELQKHL